MTSYKMDTCILLYIDNIEVTRILVTAGTDLEAKGVFEETALIYATKKDNKDLVKLLVQADADLNAKNDYDQTALVCALLRSNVEIFKLLTQNGLKFEIVH